MLSPFTHAFIVADPKKESKKKHAYLGCFNSSILINHMFTQTVIAEWVALEKVWSWTHNMLCDEMKPFHLKAYNGGIR